MNSLSHSNGDTNIKQHAFLSFVFKSLLILILIVKIAENNAINKLLLPPEIKILKWYIFRSKSNAIYRWNTEHNTNARISRIMLCSFFSIQKIIRKRSMKFCKQNLNWNFFVFWWLPHTETSIQTYFILRVITFRFHEVSGWA